MCVCMCVCVCVRAFFFSSWFGGFIFNVQTVSMCIVLAVVLCACYLLVFVDFCFVVYFVLVLFWFVGSYLGCWWYLFCFVGVFFGFFCTAKI